MSQPRNSGVIGMMLALSVLLGAASAASAQKAAIVTALRSGEAAWGQYVKTKIIDTGLYPGGVDQIDAASTDPSATTLVAYKLVVVLASDYGLSSADGFGNALGDYLTLMPTGAVLLFQPYTFQTGLAWDPAVGGSFLANYALTTQGDSDLSTATKRGDVLSDSPMVEGVPAFACGSACKRVTGQKLAPGATLVASWADGTMLAVQGKRRVDLNMLPADDSVITGSWEAAGGRLITNAILYLSTPLLQTPRRADFPKTGPGLTSGPTAFTFRNISDAALTITNIGIDGPGRGQFQFTSSTSPTPSAPYTLAVGASFTAQVWFKPQLAGAFQATLFVELSGKPRLQVPLQGGAVGNLYLSQSPINFGGIPSSTTAGPVSVLVKNTGTMPIDLDKPIIADSTHFELVPAVPDAKITMSPGATYSFDVKFVPGAVAGDYSTKIWINSTDTVNPLTIPVRALAGPPQAQIGYSSLLLPDVPTGAMGMPINVNITNSGNSDLTVLSITADKPDFTVPNAPTMTSPLVIVARDTKTFQLVFTPQLPGLRTGTLSIKTDEPISKDHAVLLAGTGTQPKFHLSVSDLDFGVAEIGQPSVPKTVDLINDGDGDLTVKDVAVVMDTTGSYSVVSSSAVPFILRAHTTATFMVSLAPKSAGQLTAMLRVVTDLPTSGTATVALKGTANGSVGQISPAMLNFGDAKVRQKVSQTVTLTNVGNKDLTITKSSLTPMMGIFLATLPASGTKLMPGKSLTINVDCMPAMVGMATGKIDIMTDDPSVMGGTTFTVQISVNGVIGNISVMPPLVDFSNTPIYVGQSSAPQLITVTNTGTTTIDNLTLMPSGPDASEFTVVTGFKSKLMPTESTQIGIMFAPHIAKTASTATLVLLADGVQVTMMVGLKGQSLSPLLTVRPADLTFDHTTVGAMTAQKFVVLSNDGAQPLELDILLPASEDFVIDLAAFNTTLAPGANTKLAVTFAPKSSGQKIETIDIRRKNTMGSIASISISGNATNVMTMMMEPTGCSAVSTHTKGSLPVLLAALLAMGLFVRRRLSRRNFFALPR